VRAASCSLRKRRVPGEMIVSFGEAIARGMIMMKHDAIEKRIKELKERIEDLKARLPKHSVPTVMLIELEDMEEELEELEAGTNADLH